jgi:2-haloacid dehalogenase
MFDQDAVPEFLTNFPFPPFFSRQKISDEMRSNFGASVQFWPPFPDTPEALQRLQKHFKLVILSNVNRDSFALSEKNMNAKFDLVCTAQDIVRI